LKKIAGCQYLAFCKQFKAQCCYLALDGDTYAQEQLVGLSWCTGMS